MIKFLIILNFLVINCWAELISLPKPEIKGKKSLEEVIYNRKAIRTYKKEPLSLKQVSQLLWSAGGINCDGITGPTRSSPSAGGIYPIEIYLVAGNVIELEPGVYHYLWRKNCLEKIKKGDLRKKLFRACWWQSAVRNAAILIILGGNYQKTISRYGKRGRDYIFMELGHMAQNLILQAEALNLGSVVIGAFRRNALKKITGIKQEPLYIITIGKKKD